MQAVPSSVSAGRLRDASTPGQAAAAISHARRPLFTAENEHPLCRHGPKPERDEAVIDTHPPDERFATVDTYIKRVHGEQDQLIETLHVAQDVFGYLSPEVLRYVARALRLPPSLVLGVATFYHLFRFEPPGDHMCIVCAGTACFVKGADAVTDALSAELGVAVGQTTSDRRVTLGVARCIGSCGLAPVAVLDGNVLAHQTPESAVAAVRKALASDSPGQVDQTEQEEVR
jgi:bidirectional [NiFe] hydrogenase diaphorase subunit